MNKNMNLKHIARPLTVKTISDDGIFEGYGSVFNIEDSYKDVVVPGAFKKSLSKWEQKGMRPALLWQHDSRQPIGVYEEMKEDGHGLFVVGRLLKDEVQKAAEAHALLKAKAISGLSIGYCTIVDEYNRETGVNVLKEVDIWETSLVTFPANDAARVTEVKSITTIREFEKFLRDAGFSRSEAKRIAGKGFERREAVEDELAALIKETIASMRG